ncbi:MAG TPA: PAS domain S-box protein, partial [Verrucomicrobiae bacterium]
NPSGQPDRILLGIEDITGRKRATEAATRLAAIVESSDDAIISKDLNGVITSWNNGAERLFGCTAAEAVGQPVTFLVPPECVDEEQGILGRIRHGESIAHYETVRQGRGGVLIHVSLTASPIRNESGEVVGASTIARDITERRRAEASLREAQAQLADRAGQLEQAVTDRTAELTATNKQLETFIYSIAHDLRAPLRAMQGFSSMLVQEAGETLTETARDYAQRISKAAQFMDSLLIDLLGFSRISQQRLELAPVNLEEVIASVLPRLEQDIQEKNARVEAPGPWPVVLGHAPVLEQVLVNLLNNALKFVAPGTRPRIRLWAEPVPAPASSPAAIDSQPSTPDPQLVRIWVEDNGIGIPAGQHEHVFRLFNRLHGDKFPGTGIGLAIVQKAVERMGGNVGVESFPGQGSLFWIDLRRVPGPG